MKHVASFLSQKVSKVKRLSNIYEQNTAITYLHPYMYIGLLFTCTLWLLI